MTEPKLYAGGPAFPIGSGDMRDPTGMTLRDYFAAAALTGWLADGHINHDPKHDAEWMYRIADAMLAARGGGRP